MEVWNLLLQGFGVALQPINLGWALVGVTLGTIVGVLPGLGPAVSIALLLPLTTKIEPAGALIMFAGIYYGAMYGGSTTSILLNTPGESATIVTAMEGNQMAKRGRAGPALATAAVGSFVAGTIATVLLTVLAPQVVDLAIRFGPPEYFALMMLAFITVSAVLGNSPLRGLTALFVGLAIGIVGIENQSGQARFVFGVPQLADGIEVVTIAVGLFAVGETLYLASKLNSAADKIESIKGSIMMTRDDWKRSWKPWLRGTAIGFPIGAMPAGGAEIPTFLSYGVEKKLAKNPEEFGKGAIEGVAGPEAANNASSTGVMVPLLTLGLPTSATAAILLAAFQQYGLQPGPLLFETNPALVWGLIASFYVGNVMLLVLNLPLIGIWIKLLEIPRPQLYAGILVFAAMGVYGMRQSAFDVFLLYVIGCMGFLMRRYDFPAAPVLIGMILGPLAEEQMRRSLSISQGNPLVFFERPLSGSILVLAIAILVGPWLWKTLRKRNK
ncbi:MAG TPA: tripartite tricarboxylate transporter permease [Casimicrobium sp.]|jgi:putative tricarboxylic transport membrane protein|nr:tripartite tricarboxylate transporter permease [Casimicrobium sp.]